MCGAVATLLLFPFCGDPARLRLKRDWSAALVDAFGVRVEANTRHAMPGCLIVANHISWLDIFVINAVLPSAFVAKDDIRAWPLFGWLAAKSDTIFLRRGSRGHARLINAAIADILDAGKYVAVFPEGTTTDGRSLLHFHAALIQPALAAGRPVLPVALSYWAADGERSLAPRYDGDISLGACISAILHERQLVVRLSTTPLLGPSGEDRKQVALAARQAIASAAGLPLVSMEPETPLGLPVEPR
ncbi:MAG: 1-acyl-sn-glycerol-3-phosphate acyltransferase [Rhodocyclaceae bacterium]|nr:1-acyl-sn-glycerol-3-phosphate acyltransferase [Dechloromonas sp.]TEX46112.1 MAG: 1-acyl-sn-glycerol-3-phosphate acyltransferase [Rhodocyclaceae bacterium]